MTDDRVARTPRRGKTEWSEAEARYRTASEALRTAMIDSQAKDVDVDDSLARNHSVAAKALIETPATHLGHVAVKIRAADNLLGLTASYPLLPDLLLADLFGMMGLNGPDGETLPPRVLVSECRRRETFCDTHGDPAGNRSDREAISPTSSTGPSNSSLSLLAIPRRAAEAF